MPDLPSPTILPLGDAAVLVRFADSLSDEANRRAIGFAAAPGSRSARGRRGDRRRGWFRCCCELRPGDRFPAAGRRVAAARSAATLVLAGEQRTIAVTFDGEDLSEVAALLKSRRRGFRRAAQRGAAARAGDGLCAGLRLLRLPSATPWSCRGARRVRPMVPAGTVLFAAGQTAIAATPIRTGWHVIGTNRVPEFRSGARCRRPCFGPATRSASRWRRDADHHHPRRAADDAAGSPAASACCAHGISASGPMDRGAFAAAGRAARARGDRPAIEFTAAGWPSTSTEPLRARCAGGEFALTVNGNARDWPAQLELDAGDSVEIAPGPSGNYGYLRFDREIDVPPVLGSRVDQPRSGSAASRAGRCRPATGIALRRPRPRSAAASERRPPMTARSASSGGSTPTFRRSSCAQRFVDAAFRSRHSLDRMGVRLADPAGVFADQRRLSRWSPMRSFPATSRSSATARRSC